MGLFGGISKVLGGGLVGLLSGGGKGEGDRSILDSVPLFGLLGEQLIKKQRAGTDESERSAEQHDDNERDEWWRTLMAARRLADGDYEGGINAMPLRRKRRSWGEAGFDRQSELPGGSIGDWWGRG